MNLYDFLDELFILFPNSYSKENRNSKERQYMSVLDNPKIDFKKLLKRMTQTYMGDFMPPPAWFLEESVTCYKNGDECQYLEVTRLYDPRPDYQCERKASDYFPKGTSDEAIIRTYEKKFNCTGWKIISKVEG